MRPGLAAGAQLKTGAAERLPRFLSQRKQASVAKRTFRWNLRVLSRARAPRRDACVPIACEDTRHSAE